MSSTGTSPSKASELRNQFVTATVLRSAELGTRGFSREYLRTALTQGVIEKVGRGLYTAAAAPITEQHSFVQVARKVPHAVICLMSALAFHKFTTQMPSDVWLAIGPKDWAPKIDFVSNRVFRFSGAALTEGVQIHQIEGTKVRVYSPAKTVADLFKFRNKIGIDVACEALREGWRERLFTMDELLRYEEICRVRNVMKPYVTALLA